MKKKLIRGPDEIERLFPWLKKGLFQCIPHFISPAWNKDRSKFDANYYANCWKRVGFKTVTIITHHHDGYSLYPSKYIKQKPDQDYFGEQVKACKKEGIKIIAYYSVSLDSLVGSEHPDWRIRDARDRVWVPDYSKFYHYHWLCLNSPYRDFVIDQLIEIANNYNVEGFFLDILYLPPHPEKDNENDFCFCPNCHKTYSEWFNGEHLIDALGTERHDIFRDKTYEHFLTKLKEKLLKFKRPLLLTFNGAGIERFSKEISALADLLSSEAHAHLRRSKKARQFRNDKRPFQLLSCSEITWSHSSLKPTPLIELELISTVMHGGIYNIGITHAPDGRLSEDNINRLAEIGQWLKKIEKYFQDTEPIYEVAVVGYSENWIPILTKGHFLFNLIENLTNIDRYKTVIIPANHPVSLEEKEILEKYVSNGGNLLIESPTVSEYNNGPLFLESLIGCVSYGKGTKTPKTFSGINISDAHYIKVKSQALQKNLFPNEPVLIEWNEPEIINVKSAEVLGYLHFQFIPKQRTSDIQHVPNVPEFSSTKPGITLNHFGKGIVLFTALPLSIYNRNASVSPYQEILAQNCVDFLLGEKIVDVEGFNKIEIHVNKKGSSYLLNFINHNYDQGEYINAMEEQEEYRNLFISLSNSLAKKSRRILTRPENQELPLIKKDNKIGFVLPSLKVYKLTELILKI